VSTTPLHFAASLGFSSFVRKLLGQKDKIDAKVGIYGGALSVGDDEIFGALAKCDVYGFGLFLCELLLGWGCDEDMSGVGMVDRAVCDEGMGCEGIVCLLVEKVVPNNTKPNIYGYALHAAAWNGREDLVRWLVESKDSDINAKRGIYGTVLHVAAAYGHKGVVSALIENGANINAKGGMYGTALQAALSEGHEDVAQMLLDAGASLQYDHDTPGNAKIQDTVKRMIRQVPSDSLTLGTNIASALRISGLWREAIMVLEPIVQKSIRVLGLEHRSTLNSMAVLAHIYADLGRMEAAFDLLQKVLYTQTLTLGKDHPDTKYSRECLCACVAGSVHWPEVEGEYKVRLWLSSTDQ